MINEIIKMLLNNHVIAAILVPGLVTGFLAALIIIWIERKIVALVQMRYGPLYVSKRIGGFLQPVADFIKLIFSELVIHGESDRVIFTLAPILMFTIAILPVAFIPVSPEIYVINCEYGLIIAIAIAMLSSIVISVAGWASNDKFTFIGTAREALMTLAYEVPLLLAVLSMIIIYETGEPLSIIYFQRTLPGIILNPISFIVFIISIMMITSRFPFEIPEAETEIVFGPFTEYGSILFALSMGSVYVELYSLSLIAAMTYLGGWWGPGIMNNVTCIFWTLMKTFILMIILVLLRAIYPRLRVDQALTFSWKFLFTLGIISVFWSLFLRVYVIF